MQLEMWQVEVKVTRGGSVNCMERVIEGVVDDWNEIWRDCDMGGLGFERS